MPELQTVIDNECASNDSGQLFPVELFECCSREELCSLLFLMHRILKAERQRDFNALFIDLPRFVQESLFSPKIPFPGDIPPSGLAMDRNVSLLADYLLSCLVQAQARIDARMLQQRVPHPLSSRELTVLGWMKEGKTNWEIARILGLSERTIRFHIGRIFEKLNVTSRTQAVVRALGTGLIAS
jgi:DNA-binding CsgD family transcriptional regulator